MTGNAQVASHQPMTKHWPMASPCPMTKHWPMASPWPMTSYKLLNSTNTTNHLPLKTNNRLSFWKFIGLVGVSSKVASLSMYSMDFLVLHGIKRNPWNPWDPWDPWTPWSPGNPWDPWNPWDTWDTWNCLAVCWGDLGIDVCELMHALTLGSTGIHCTILACA